MRDLYAELAASYTALLEDLAAARTAGALGVLAGLHRALIHNVAITAGLKVAASRVDLEQELGQQLAADRARLDPAVVGALSQYPEAHLRLARALDQLDQADEPVA